MDADVLVGVAAMGASVLVAVPVMVGSGVPLGIAAKVGAGGRFGVPAAAGEGVGPAIIRVWGAVGVGDVVNVGVRASWIPVGG